MTVHNWSQILQILLSKYNHQRNMLQPKNLHKSENLLCQIIAIPINLKQTYHAPKKQKKALPKIHVIFAFIRNAHISINACLSLSKHKTSWKTLNYPAIWKKPLSLHKNSTTTIQIHKNFMSYLKSEWQDSIRL